MAPAQVHSYVVAQGSAITTPRQLMPAASVVIDGERALLAEPAMAAQAMRQQLLTRFVARSADRPSLLDAPGRRLQRG